MQRCSRSPTFVWIRSLITQWLPAADFGYYLVAVSVYTSACSLITLLGSLVFPKMAAAENDAVRAEVLGRYLRLALTLAVTGGIILLLVAPWLITLVYGRPYLPAAGVLQILAVGIAPMTFEVPSRSDIQGSRSAAHDHVGRVHIAPRLAR